MKRMTRVVPILLCALLLMLFAQTALASAADPTGASYATATGSETIGDVAVAASKAQYSANFVWVMIAAFMVFFFQCGFAMVETGFCRAKNAAHTITMNFMVFLVGAIGYFICGFALQFGGSGGAAGLGTGGSVLDAMLTIPGFGGILGHKGFGLLGTYDAGVYLLFFFQMVFMDTTCTIPTGSMAERVKYSAVVISLVLRIHAVLPAVWQLAVGRRLAIDAGQVFWFLVMARWTLRVRRLCTQWAV